MAALSTYYDGSFASVGFLELFESGTAPEPDIKTKDAVLEIPGSNNVVYQDFGQGAVLLDLRVAVGSLASIQAKRGTRGSLVYHAGTVNARLRHITNIQKDFLGFGAKVTLSFIIG